MKYLIVIVLFFNFMSAEEKFEYLYFPSKWPKHENIKMEDGIMKKVFSPLGEKPLHSMKDVNAYRMISNKGIVSLYITKDNKCDIYFHAIQKEQFEGFADGDPFLTFSMKKIDKCLEKVDIKGIERLLFYVEASFYTGFLGTYLTSYLTIEMIDYYGEYHYISSKDPDQQKTINDFVDQIETFFKKNGIDVHKKPENLTPKKVDKNLIK